MRLIDFRELSKEEKIEIIIDSKISMYLGHRMVENIPIYLYWYDGIFIEMSFSKKSQKDVIINAFTGVVPLYFYVEFIDISDIN